ncbi:4-hydroxy-tetrahydrodipicolinate reductase [Synechococcus elongatus]|uniref:4-hydroxy-tetrahydrodipicolinate reductase n=1 Tax=Synechococcus elongatus TaxID=32046 RepID=UPI0030CE4DBD
MAHPIPVVVNGATGKMGRETIKAIAAADDLTLVGAIARSAEVQGQDIGEIVGIEPLEVPVTHDLEGMLCLASQEREVPVVVDFTHPDCIYDNVRKAIAYGVRPVVGTTGLTNEQLQELAEFADKASVGCLVIPNFSIGMVLLMQAAIQASRFYDHVEILELHHDQKADAPSGTAIKTAQMLAELGKTFNPAKVTEKETMPGARGALGPENIRIHSVRLPGLIAHEEVIFGAPGEILTLRHDTMDRSCYMPGVLLAVRKVRQLTGLIYGLDRIL